MAQHNPHSHARVKVVLFIYAVWHVMAQTGIVLYNSVKC